ncbi:lycopene cyclase domain-containing protein [Chryseobacterium daeguense]|uniref:lycopene cyclase domain-containing protein n=1 Tax=Chryseobacterium daeguense TaxID=412438 RepID=UPI0004141050|nr:lycopene cyclase domain-containing protein [Chryseobacterium daeguense]
MFSYTYLLINFFTIIVCFIFSFHQKIKFNKHFKAFLAASFLVAVVFIIWDIWFTKMGVWWFNDRYLLGIRLFGLPVEEIMFFFCIPFACMFTYFCLDKFFNLNWKLLPEKIFVIVSIIVLITLGVFFKEKIYSCFTFFTTAFSMFMLYFVLKSRWMGRASFIYLVLMPGFLLVNGILTGTGLESPIVNYNPSAFIGFRILTIPVEDTVYGYELILWNIYFFQKFKKRRVLSLTSSLR